MGEYSMEGLGVVTPMRSLTPSLSTGSTWFRRGPGDYGFVGPTRVASHGGITQGTVYTSRTGTRDAAGRSYDAQQTPSIARDVTHEVIRRREQNQRRGADRARTKAYAERMNRYAGATIPGVRGFDDIVLPVITPQMSLLRGAAIGLCIYHGYKRNHSIGWALAWGLLGSAFPIIAVPVALAQGLGQPKHRSNRRRRRNSTGVYPNGKPRRVVAAEFRRAVPSFFAWSDRAEVHRRWVAFLDDYAKRGWIKFSQRPYSWPTPSKGR